ncbi:hypothetical protein I4U23_002304 [Adineta vaga]|nr:hypothetical protein I4U23_002304 [Adineta vaga]
MHCYISRQCEHKYNRLKTEKNISLRINMEYSCTRLNDLPDEILMMICQKLNNFDVLYCLKGINQRFDRIVHDSIFTSRLSFVKCFKCNFIDLLQCDAIRNRYCLQILPDIHDKIKRLDLEASSVKQILHATDYPNLNSLGLYNIVEESVRHLSMDDLITDENLSKIFKNQITTLTLAINEYYDMFEAIANIFNFIFIMFPRLTTLILCEPSYKNRVPLNFDDLLLPTFRSSTLLQLIINVQSFDDCLCLLDGRFIHLHTLRVNLTNICSSNEIQNQGDLPNLKRLSMFCNYETWYYNERVLPLLHRMYNLEELSLCLTICQDRTFILGNNLKKDIINYMSRLIRFSFSIDSFTFMNNPLNLPSTEDVQQTFIDFLNIKVISCIDYFSRLGQVRCLTYSYPSLMQYYGIITNNFPGGLFINVRTVSLVDERPFEHEFFNRIHKSFPFMERLDVHNDKPQNFKQFYDSFNDNRNLSVIKYPFLNDLRLGGAHDDYIEQFLLQSKACFEDSSLSINYRALQRITHNFTRDDTRINCAKIIKLVLYGDKKHSSCLQEYFPRAKICYSPIF